MMPAVFGAAARVFAPMAGQAVNTFVQGKTGENIGGYNEAQSAELRRSMATSNEDPNAQANRNAANTDRAADGSDRRSAAQTAFQNQLTQSNKRADLTNQMAIYDQDNAYRRGEQLANAYTSTANNQANANANVLQTMLGVQGNYRR